MASTRLPMLRRRLRITRVWDSSSSMPSNGPRQILRPATAVTASASSVIDRPSIAPTQRNLPLPLGSLGPASATAARALRPQTLTAARHSPRQFARSITVVRTAKPSSLRWVKRMKALANVNATRDTTAAIASCGKESRATSMTATTEHTEETNLATWGSGQTAIAIAGVANSISLVPLARTGHLEGMLGSTDPQAATSLFSGKAKVDVGEDANPRGSWGRSVCAVSTVGTGAVASTEGRAAALGTPASSVAPRSSQRIQRVSLASRRMPKVSTDASRAEVTSRCPCPRLLRDSALKENAR